MNADWEKLVITAYEHHLALALPLSIVGIKLIVRVIARERARDLFRSVLVIPLDFVYIAIALLLAAVSRRDPHLILRYGSDVDADMAAAVLIVALSGGAVIITLMDRALRALWQKFCAAWSLFGKERALSSDGGTQSHIASDESGQILLQLQEISPPSGPPLSRQCALLLMWILLYWSVMVPLQIAEAVVGVFSLSSVLQRIQ